MILFNNTEMLAGVWMFFQIGFTYSYSENK